MAIKRCPYCRSIIDEKDRICNNCGTQLIFPEDDSVEEEIPGEKIIDVDLEEKDYEIPEPETDDEDSSGLSGDGEQIILDDTEDDTEDDIVDEDEEVILVDDAEQETEFVKPSPTESLKDEAPIAPIWEVPAAGDAFPAASKTHEIEEVEEERSGTPEEKDSGENVPRTFDTGDLDKIGKTAEIGKDQVENFLDVLKKKEEENSSLRKETEEDADLPPWAAEIRKSDMDADFDSEVKDEMKIQNESDEIESEDEDTEDDETSEEIGLDLPRHRATDSGIGLPEKVTQSVLPFEREIPRDGREAPPASAPAAFRRRETYSRDIEDEEPVARRKPPFHLSIFLKAKAFDAMFVVVFWLVSLVLAAKAMDVNLFRLLQTAPEGLLVYLGILLVIYFFLFYFFLGETLGDRLFRDED